VLRVTLARGGVRNAIPVINVRLLDSSISVGVLNILELFGGLYIVVESRSRPNQGW
jgi:hypothetical protein